MIRIILLMTFVLSLSCTQQKEAPKVKPADCGDFVAVTIDASGDVSINDKKIEENRIQDKMVEIQKRCKISYMKIMSDQNAKNAVIVKVMTAAKDSGYAQIEML